MRFPDNSYGSPYVNIYFHGKSGVRALQMRLTEFKFTFTDKDGRHMIATIKTDDITLPGLEEYQEKAKWEVTWGYLQGKSCTKTMYIKDISPRYDAEGLTFNIKLKDLAHFMDKDSSRDVFENSSALDIAKQLSEKNGLEGVKVEDGVNPPFIYNNLPRNDGNLPAPFSLGSATSNTYAYNPAGQGAFVKQECNVQANKTSAELIKETLAKDIGGPYNLTSEDGYLIIRKLNLNKKPSFTYYYRHDDGKLISFTPETKNENHLKASSKMGALVMDSLNKTFNNLTVDQLTDNTGDPSATPLGDTVVDPTTATSVPLSTQIKDGVSKGVQGTLGAINPALGQLAGIGINALGFGEGQGPTGIGLQKNFTRNSSNVKYYDFSWKPATENTSTIQQDRGPMKEAIQPITNAPAPLGEALADLNNQRRLRALDKNPGKAVVVGDPDLREAQVGTFLGLAPAQSGNYYICDVTHIITNHQGYLCELSTLRNSTTSTGTEPECFVRGKDFGIVDNTEVGPINDIINPESNRIPTKLAEVPNQ